MPAIRVMNWNIEQLSNKKVRIAGMSPAIARTVVAANIDIFIVLEVKKTQVGTAMTALSAALTAAEGGGNSWRGYFLSHLTGGEFYCVFIRDLNRVRPMYVESGPVGTSGDPLTDMRKNVFAIWPTPDWNADAYPIAQPYPRIPICDAWATPRRPRRKKKANFGGQPIGAGGYSLGRGFRLPALALFWIHTGAGDTVVPMVTCHYAAVRGRGARNILAQSQVNQLDSLQMPQFFNDHVPFAASSRYLQYLDALGNVQMWNTNEVCFTGDFNLDFLQNYAGVGATNLQLTNHLAYVSITPTPQQGGSAGPAANAGVPELPVPAPPYEPPFTAPMIDEIRSQSLRAAITTQGTLMHRYPLQYPMPAWPPPVPYGAVAFDNFFYGGSRLNSAAPGFGVGNLDSGQVVNVPDNIVMQGGIVNNRDIDVSGVAMHYAAKNTKNARNAPRLQAAAGPALTDNDRLVGARMISDHLPVVLEFQVP